MVKYINSLAVTLTCAAGLVASAQNAPPQFARSFCIKVQPGKNAEFLKLMSDFSKPVAQVRADAGEFTARFLTRSIFPAGQEATCDFELVYFYPGFPPDPKTTMNGQTAYEKAHVSMKPAEFVAQRNAISRLRKSELWRIRSRIGSPEVGNYLRHNYVKVQPTDMGPWLKLEQDTLKPVHEQRIEMGAFKAWALTTLAMPSGSALPYNAMTVDVYKDWSALGAPSRYKEAFQKANKGEMSAAFTELTRLRGAFVRTELYEIVEVTAAHPGTRGASAEQ